MCVFIQGPASKVPLFRTDEGTCYFRLANGGLLRLGNRITGTILFLKGLSGSSIQCRATAVPVADNGAGRICHFGAARTELPEVL